ncbi:MAG TPA: serine/threonine-protein kinase, partial [Gemmata sp.]|nr:serine/threonine-protein kinase [Gemmata sp.]
MDSQTGLVTILCEQWEEARRRGENLSPEDLCRDRPELLEEVRRAIRNLAAIDHFDDRTAPHSTTGLNPVGSASDKAASDGTAASAGAELPTLPGYQIKGEIGRGGMGIVYRATDTQLRREVAIKMMLPRLAADPRSKARFLREARNQAKVEHDHVVVIHQVGEHDGIPFLAMPLLKGQTLSSALKQNPRPPIREVVRIGREIAEGLAAAHEQGLVHRDIKPGNIWLEGSKRRVKILDFGLARVADVDHAVDNESDEHVSAAGAIVGTPAYMAPEQAWGNPADARADLFSLGIVLYQMAIGRLPFQAANARAMLALLTTSNPTPPCQHVLDFPPPLNALILHLLAKEPADRPPSAQAVADALRQLELGIAAAVPVEVIALDSIPRGSTAPNPWADIETTEAGTAEASVHRTVTVPNSGRTSRPLLLWGLMGLAVLVGGGLVVAKLLKSAEPRGVLFVDADDPEMEIVVKQNGQEIRGRTKEREFVLPPGEYIVEPAERRNGLRVKPDRVMVGKGGRETVAMWVDKPKPKLSPSPDADRKAAEMLLPHSSRLNLKLTSGRYIDVKPGEQLPNEPFILNAFYAGAGGSPYSK